MAMSEPIRRHGVTLTPSAGSRISGFAGGCRPCAAKISCGECAGTPGKHGSPPGSFTRGASDSQNVS